MPVPGPPQSRSDAAAWSSALVVWARPAAASRTAASYGSRSAATRENRWHRERGERRSECVERGGATQARQCARLGAGPLLSAALLLQSRESAAGHAGVAAVVARPAHREHAPPPRGRRSRCGEDARSSLQPSAEASGRETARRRAVTQCALQSPGGPVGHAVTDQVQRRRRVPHPRPPAPRQLYPGWPPSRRCPPHLMSASSCGGSPLARVRQIVRQRSARQTRQRARMRGALLRR